jgi:hypothetical protein
MAMDLDLVERSGDIALSALKERILHIPRQGNSIYSAKTRWSWNTQAKSMVQHSEFRAEWCHDPDAASEIDARLSETGLTRRHQR